MRFFINILRRLVETAEKVDRNAAAVGRAYGNISAKDVGGWGQAVATEKSLKMRIAPTG